MKTKEISLTPYLTFQGNCEEALKAYREIFQGTFEIVQRYDNPAMQAPENYKNKVLHARLQFGVSEIFASDIFPGKSVSGSSNVSLSLSFPNPEEAKPVFDKLAEGGKVSVPFAKQFWGAWHGNLTDRFGILWMVNCE